MMLPAIPGRETALVRRSLAATSLEVPGQVRYIVVIARTRVDLYVEMRRDFEDDPSIRVILDRRAMERGRRTPHRQAPGDRRRRERRVREEHHRELARFGYVLVRAASS
jgi:hypothetical protein